MQLYGQQKVNHKNPFILAFREIYIPRKLPHIRYNIAAKIPGLSNTTVLVIYHDFKYTLISQSLLVTIAIRLCACTSVKLKVATHFSGFLNKGVVESVDDATELLPLETQQVKNMEVFQLCSQEWQIYTSAQTPTITDTPII